MTSLFIVELSVHLDWQGKGIGRQLINAVADHAREGAVVADVDDIPRRTVECAVLCAAGV